MSKPVPSRLCKKISQDAVEIAKMYGKRRGWKSTAWLSPSFGVNKIGISTGFAFWLQFQNRGTRPFIPWGLEGKTVPLPHKPSVFNPHSINFRKAVGVGQPGFVHDPEVYETLHWREAKWKNPGIKATYFLNKALHDAIKKNESELKKYLPKRKKTVIRIKTSGDNSGFDFNR
ncbi:MAG: hypothetical protein IIZ04_03785 [Aeriscardovia sp.]|nr:hypothetical protein [Aeriscardovia sp.]